VDAPLPSPLPEIVARLDGEPVYLRQVTPLVRAKLDKVGGRATEKPALVREALREYLDRELLLREAMARGVEPDTRQLQQLYDKARAEFTDETQWEQSLVGRGLDPQSFKVELRVQQTVSLFVARESGTEDMGATQEAMSRRAAAVVSLLERLRARSRIETYL
jgi:hypothetical protein